MDSKIDHQNTLHTVKCFEERFWLLKSGICKADIRLNDRSYKKKDDLILFQEGMPSLEVEGDYFKATGNTLRAVITHIDTFGLKEGYVALSLDILD